MVILEPACCLNAMRRVLGCIPVLFLIVSRYLRSLFI